MQQIFPPPIDILSTRREWVGLMCTLKGEIFDPDSLRSNSGTVWLKKKHAGSSRGGHPSVGCSLRSALLSPLKQMLTVKYYQIGLSPETQIWQVNDSTYLFCHFSHHS